MRVVVAGGTGLAGSAIVRGFESAGYKVIALNSKSLNLLNESETKDFFLTTKPNVVIDAAARVGGIHANNSFPVEFLVENLRIQNNLMEACHLAKVESFVFLGSSCIYPRDCEQPMKEEFLMTGLLEETNSAYAVAKIAGIELVKSYRKQHGLKWISLMPTNLYGPGDNFSLTSSHVFPAFIRKFDDAVKSKAEKVVLWGTGSPLREFLHVDDLAQAVLIALTKYDSSVHLNVGTGIEISIRDLAVKIATEIGFKGDIEWDASKPSGTPRKVMNVSRIKELGWEPRISLESGIKSTISWYRLATPLGEVRI
jgi:GDP-L-fucose synthase